MSACKAVLDKEIAHERSDGEKIPLAVSATPILEESGTCGGAVLIFRDLREIKKLEKRARRAEKLAAMGQLSAAVAHEIRNPLSSIRGFAQFLAHVLKDKPADREYAEIMVKEIDRINQVVTDLLTFARPLESKKEPVGIVETIDHAIRLITPELAARNVRIRKKVGENVEKAPMDRDQITQVLLNLTLNALDETPAGSQLSIGAAFEGKKGEILVWVEDEGPGIAPENRKSVFDPFFTTKEKGTGLGLSIVKKIVENHEGRVFIVSPPPGKNRGARVGFGIPAEQASTNENGEVQ
jgi:two-component system sensor histidine kinase HydH